MATHIEQRQTIAWRKAHAQIFFDPVKLEPLIDMDTAEFGNFDQPLIDVTAYGAMDSANKGYTITCNAWKDNSTAISNNSDNSNIAEGVLDISFPTVGTAVGLSAAAIDNYVSSCTTEEETPHGFVIVPADGLDVDDLSALLQSFPNANVVPHVSLNGFGIMYWTADLTPSQWKQVTQSKQVSNFWTASPIRLITTRLVCRHRSQL
jgi:hypothetical protein